jgi:hypothetical protein
VPTPAASGVAEPAAIYGSLICVASVFVSWRSKGKSLASLSPVGNVMPIADFQFWISIGKRQLEIENGVC